MSVFELRYGKSYVSLDVPDENILQVIEGTWVAALDDVAAEVICAIDNPINSLPSKSIVVPTDKVAIVVSDITRGWIRYSLFLTVIVDYLNDAGVPD